MPDFYELRLALANQNGAMEALALAKLSIFFANIICISGRSVDRK